VPWELADEFELIETNEVELELERGGEELLVGAI